LLPVSFAANQFELPTSIEQPPETRSEFLNLSSGDVNKIYRRIR
jgi:hypothetical protein